MWTNLGEKTSNFFTLMKSLMHIGCHLTRVEKRDSEKQKCLKRKQKISKLLKFVSSWAWVLKQSWHQADLFLSCWEGVTVFFPMIFFPSFLVVWMEWGWKWLWWQSFSVLKLQLLAEPGNTKSIKNEELFDIELCTVLRLHFTG